MTRPFGHDSFYQTLSPFGPTTFRKATGIYWEDGIKWLDTAQWYLTSSTSLTPGIWYDGLMWADTDAWDFEA